MSKREIMGEILEILRYYETFLISSHINPDGDAVGSQLAFYLLLSDLGKKVSVVNSDPVPFIYSFLPDVAALQCVEYTSNKGNTKRAAKDAGHLNFESGILSLESVPDVDVTIILDCGNLSRIGKELADRVHPRQALINIDHHRSNEHFGTHNLVDAGACATAELAFHLMEHGGMEVSQSQALCLYTAILTDTGCFRYTNTTAEAHRIAAQLIDKGVRPAQVAESVYEVIPYRRARLLGMALQTLQLSSDGGIAWVSVTGEMYEQTGTGSADTEGIIEYVRSLGGIKVAIMFRELENGDVKVSLRSKGEFNVERIASMFGGGGHRAAAGCNISEPLDKAIDMILRALREGMGDL